MSDRGERSEVCSGRQPTRAANHQSADLGTVER